MLNNELCNLCRLLLLRRLQRPGAADSICTVLSEHEVADNGHSLDSPHRVETKSILWCNMCWRITSVKGKPESCSLLVALVSNSNMTLTPEAQPSNFQHLYNNIYAACVYNKHLATQRKLKTFAIFTAPIWVKLKGEIDLNVNNLRGLLFIFFCHSFDWYIIFVVVCFKLLPSKPDLSVCFHVLYAMLTAGPQLLSDLHLTYVSRRCGKEEEEEAEEEQQQQEQQKIHHCACRLISDFFFTEVCAGTRTS